jgi:hypothetical protein
VRLPLLLVGAWQQAPGDPHQAGSTMLLSAAALALAGTTRTADAASQRFHQDRFLISYWVGPQVPIGELDERFAEIAAANFTGHLGFNGNGNSHGLYNDTDIHPTKERVSAEIALCDKYDLVCIPTLCGKVDVRSGALPEECLHLGENSPNFWGFQLMDEPSSSLFPAMGNFSKLLAAARPKALQYYNLLGSGAYSFPNQTSYEEYWASYIASVNPDVLSQDFYPDFQISRGEPLTTHLRESKERYAISLAVQRKQGLSNGVPFWNFLNTMPFSAEHADPTEVRKRISFVPFYAKKDHFTKTGSGQT